MKTKIIFLLVLVLAMTAAPLRVSAAFEEPRRDKGQSGEQGSDSNDRRQNSTIAADQAAQASNLEALAGAGSGFIDDDDDSVSPDLDSTSLNQKQEA